MKKRSRKLISILLTLSLLVTLLVPLATPAAASGTYSAVNVPTVSDEGDQALGKVKVSFDVDDVSGAQTLFFKLPTDFKYFPDAVSLGSIVNVGGDDALGVGASVYVELTTPGTGNPLALADLAIAEVSDNEFKVTYVGTPSGAGTDSTGYFYVDFKKAYVPSYDGDVTVTIDTPNGSAFGDGSVVIGKTSDGEVTVSVVDTETSNSDFTVRLRVKENVVGALSNEADSLKFILPDGYEWKNTFVVGTDYASIWGQDPTIVASDFTYDADELSLDPNFESTTEAMCFELSLDFEVVDEEEVEAGDITMNVKGESTVSPSTLVVGKYGDYSATAYAVDEEDLPTVYAGKVEQEISNIMIEESIEDSLTAGRYIKLELPSAARWTTVPDTVTDSGITLTFAGIAGSEGNVAKYTVSGTGSSAAELELEDMEVLLDVTAPGDLMVKVSGNAGIEGEFAVAKIASSASIAADSKPEVKIGMKEQKIGDITITESKEGSLEDGKTITLNCPLGTEFSSLPKVEVTAGDIKLDTAGMSRWADGNGAYRYVDITVDNDSNEASTIKVSEIYLNVDRTVAEGNVNIALVGDAVLESNGTPAATWFKDVVGTDADIDNDGTGDYDKSSSLFPGTLAYAAATAAVVNTPAPGETKANASFVIGSTTYNVGGVEMTMDVAPYVKDGRTFLPVRYVAQALGVADANILWDAASQKVTLIKNGTVVQLTIGSNVLLLNGAAITMDVAPELTSDRTMLPIRFIAQAFGANVGWDEATQTVTLN